MIVLQSKNRPALHSRSNSRALTETLNFFIGREDIIDLVREHTFAHDRIQTGCEFLNRFRHPVPVARNGGLLFRDCLMLSSAGGRARKVQRAFERKLAVGKHYSRSWCDKRANRRCTHTHAGRHKVELIAMAIMTGAL